MRHAPLPYSDAPRARDQRTPAPLLSSLLSSWRVCGWLSATLAAVAFAGCGADFDPAARLSKLRALAVQAEPVNPAEGQSTTLTPLVYAPAADALSFAWSWCPLLGRSEDGYTCPVSYAEASALVAGAGVTTPLPSFDLGNNPTATWSNPFPASLLASLCADGFAESQIDCKHGFPVRVFVQITQGSATQVATAVLRLPVGDNDTSNANPVIGALSAELPGGEMVLDDKGSVVLPRIKDNVLRVAVDESAAETYAEPGATGAPGDHRETLLFSWFSELGDIDAARKLFIDGADTLADSSRNKFRPPATRVDARGTSKIFVVVRDDRGGVAWTSATASLEVTP